MSPAARHGPTLWAGTNAGCVFAYALKVPLQSGSWGGAVEAILSKEIQLMHRAPVVGLAVLDGQGNPLPEPYQASRDLATSLDMQASHSVLIASEEQIKVPSPILAYPALGMQELWHKFRVLRI